MQTKEYKNVSHFCVGSIHVSYTENSHMSSAVVTTNKINFSSLTWKDETESSTTASGKVFQSLGVLGQALAHAHLMGYLPCCSLGSYLAPYQVIQTAL